MSHWPHAPIHLLGEAGAYIVTAGTYRKAHCFRTAALLDFLQEQLLHLADRYDWNLQAWAIFSNHYHFVAISPSNPENLPTFIGHLHTETATEVNRDRATPGERVWYQYWETHLTYERSYLARLNYVHHNPVRHGLVRVATDYPWCSARWFEQQAARLFYRRVTGLAIDRVNVFDPFDPLPAHEPSA